MNLSKDIFERCTSIGSGLFSFLDSGFVQNFGQIVSITVQMLINANLVVLRCFKVKKTLLAVYELRSKMALLKLSNMENDLRTQGHWPASMMAEFILALLDFISFFYFFCNFKGHNISLSGNAPLLPFLYTVWFNLSAVILYYAFSFLVNFICYLLFHLVSNSVLSSAKVWRNE